MDSNYRLIYEGQYAGGRKWKLNNWNIFVRSLKPEPSVEQQGNYI